MLGFCAAEMEYSRLVGKERHGLIPFFFFFNRHPKVWLIFEGFDFWSKRIWAKRGSRIGR